MVCYVTQEMCKSKLGKLIQAFRADRPDEWMMDDFIREAESQQQTINELTAMVERLTSTIQSIEESSVDDKTWYMLNAVIDETPEQALNAIRAEVEEETIQKCISAISMGDDCSSGFTVEYCDGVNDCVHEVRSMARKYKEEG